MEANIADVVVRQEAEQTIRFEATNPNPSPMVSSRVEFRIPSGFRLVAATPGAFVSRGRLIWKVGTIGPGGYKSFFVKLEAAGRRGTKSRTSILVSGTVNGRQLRAVRLGWARIYAPRRPSFTG